MKMHPAFKTINAQQILCSFPDASKFAQIAKVDFDCITIILDYAEMCSPNKYRITITDTNSPVQFKGSFDGMGEINDIVKTLEEQGSDYTAEMFNLSEV